MSRHGYGFGPRFLYLACRFIFITTVALSLAPKAYGAGPLRVHSSNPRYFFDSNGTPVYLAGTYLGHEVLELGTKDFIAYLDFLHEQKHNFTRLWAWEQTPLSAKKPSPTLPYERTGPGQALDGGAKFDLRRFNQTYFDRLRDRVAQARERGIYVSVVLFQGLNPSSKSRRDNAWLANPWHRENNINGVDGDPYRDGIGLEAFTLAIPVITSLQEDYIRKVVDTLNDLDNVLYEISGDASLGAATWRSHIVNYLKSYEATKPNQHPVGISYPAATDNDVLWKSPADWIALYGADLNPPLAAGGRALFIETDPRLLGDRSSDQSVWKAFARGMNVIDRELDTLAPAVAEGVHAAIAQSLAYSRSIDLSALVPNDTGCSTGYCLINPGVEYLAYLPSGGRVVVDLSLAPQTFVVNWLNSLNAQTMAANGVIGGRKVILASPFAGEALLRLSALAKPSIAAPVAPTSSNTSSDTAVSSASLATVGAATLSDAVSTPTLTPNGGAFAGSITVTLADGTPGAKIYYTTDGATPTQSSAQYTSPITISKDTLLKARAFKRKMSPSAEVSAWFSKLSSFDFALASSGNISVWAGSSVANTISAALLLGTTQPVSFSFSGLPSGATGSFSSAACSPGCSTLLTITTTGTTPAGIYPVTISATGGGVTKTTSFTLSITASIALVVATPTITPNGGPFSGSVSVAMQTTTSGAAIHYTTDGSIPDESSALYSGALTLTSSATVSAKAFKSGYNPSAVASASFTNTGTTYYVATTGSDAYSCAQAKNPATPKRTITAALACVGPAGTDAGAGYTVQVASGTYDERLVDKIPSGTSWSSPFTLRSAAPLGATLRPSTNGSIIGLNNANRYIVIDGLTIDGQAQPTTGTGIALSAYNWGDIHHVRIINNEIKNTKNDGLTGGHGTYLEVVNNSIHDVGSAAPGYAHGFYSVVANSMIEKNKIYNAAGYGLHFYNNFGGAGMDNNIVRYNMVYGNRDAGILASGTNMQIYANAVYSNGSEGISGTQGGSNIYVYNNTVYGNGSYGIVNSTVSGMVVKNNISYRNGTNFAAFGTGTVQSNNLIGVDPLFVDSSSADFRLQSGSPAIGSGTCLIVAVLPSICTGSSCDIGAYPYRSGSTVLASP